MIFDGRVSHHAEVVLLSVGVEPLHVSEGKSYLNDCKVGDQETGVMCVHHDCRHEKSDYQRATADAGELSWVTCSMESP